jgi:O-antigen/teichoic acid export membrane protein
MSRSDTLIKNSLHSLLNFGMGMVFTTVTSIVVARKLGPDQLGIFMLIGWLTGTIMHFADFGLTTSIVKYVSELKAQGNMPRLNHVVTVTLFIETGICVVLTAGCGSFSSQIADIWFTPAQGRVFFIAFLGFFPGFTTAILSAIIQGLQKFEYFTFFNLIITPLSFAGKMIVLFLGYQMEGLLWVTLFFSVANMVFFFVVIRREGVRLDPGKLSPEDKKRLVNYNGTIAGINFTNNIVWNKSETFFLGRFCHATQVAYYNLGYNIAARFIDVVPGIFWNVLFPNMSELFGQGDIRNTRRLFYLSSRYIAFAVFPVGVAGIVLAFPILHYLYGTQYTAAKYVLQIVFLSKMITSVGVPASAILYAREKQSFMLKYGILLAVVSISIDLVIIRPYGAVGAAGCNALVTIAGIVGGMAYTIRQAKLSYPWKSVFKILFSCIIMGIVMAICVKLNAELLGFVLALALGPVVFFAGCAALGTFEEEDLNVLDMVRKFVPPQLRGVFDELVRILAEEKIQAKLAAGNKAADLENVKNREE